jgi:ABC-type bacteriocin/lantibiotic exporters, contain an N-terminal double-glycine peptidase domain
MFNRFVAYKQIDSMDCGPTCLRMVANYYGQRYDLVKLRDYCYASKNGVSLLGVSDAAERIGFRTRSIKTDFEKFINKAIFPCIVHWREEHFVVVIDAKVKKKKGKMVGNVYVADPAFGKVTYSVDEFLDGWINDRVNGNDKGTFMMLVPTMEFYHPDISENEKKI